MKMLFDGHVYSVIPNDSGVEVYDVEGVFLGSVELDNTFSTAIISTVEGEDQSSSDLYYTVRDNPSKKDGYIEMAKMVIVSGFPY